MEKIKAFFYKKNTDYLEKMKKHFKNLKTQTKKEVEFYFYYFFIFFLKTLTMKFFAAETEETQINSEINSSLLVRSNMSTKQVMKEANKARKYEKKTKNHHSNVKNKTLIQHDNELQYSPDPTPEEIIVTFDLILKDSQLIKNQQTKNVNLFM